MRKPDRVIQTVTALLVRRMYEVTLYNYKTNQMLYDGAVYQIPMEYLNWEVSDIRPSMIAPQEKKLLFITKK